MCPTALTPGGARAARAVGHLWAINAGRVGGFGSSLQDLLQLWRVPRAVLAPGAGAGWNGGTGGLLPGMSDILCAAWGGGVVCRDSVVFEDGAAGLRECPWVPVHPEVSSVCAWSLQKELCLSHGAVLYLPQCPSAHPRATGASLVHDEEPVAPWERGSEQGWDCPVLPTEMSCSVDSITCNPPASDSIAGNPLPRPILEDIWGRDASCLRAHCGGFPSWPAQRRALGRDVFVPSQRPAFLQSSPAPHAALAQHLGLPTPLASALVSILT